MPTGYTASIAEGITFEQFTLSCARAFGALIMMRDEPSDAQIPEEFKPSDYNEKRLAEYIELQRRVSKMTIPECKTAARKEYTDALTYHRDKITEANELRAKYDAMLSKVDAWKTPTAEHEGLKKFMREQITVSIDFDCNTKYHEEALRKVRLLGPQEWKRNQLDKAMRDIAYHSNAQLEEIKRTEDRNRWVSELRNSLKQPSASA